MNSIESLHTMLQNPLVLLVVVYVGLLMSAAKQIIVARRAGAETPSCIAYFSSYWPETLVAAGTAFVGFLTLAEAGQLNFVAALGAGAAANEAADFMRRGGRSASVMGLPETPPEKPAAGESEGP